MKLLAIVCAALLLTACGQKTVLVQGIGSVSVDPEIAQVRASISMDSNTVDGAVAAASRRVDETIVGLKEYGVEPSQVRVERFGVEPNCDYNRQSGVQTCEGYTAAHVLNIEVTDVQRVGVVLGGLAKLGLESFGDTVFSRRDLSSIQDQARRAAIDDAKRKAGLYAEANGLSLGKVLGIEDRAASESAYSRYDRRVREEGASMFARMEIAADRLPTVPLTVQKVTDEQVVYMEFELGTAIALPK